MRKIFTLHFQLGQFLVIGFLSIINICSVNNVQAQANPVSSKGFESSWATLDINYSQNLVKRNQEASFVKPDPGQTNAIINFNHVENTTTTETNVFGKQMTQPVRHVIYTRLLSTQNNITSSIDMVATAYDSNFSAGIDDMDAPKLWNVDENIAEVRDDNTLSIEFRPTPLLSDTIFYRLYLRVQPYTLQVYSQNLQGMLSQNAWLVDKYLHTKTAVNLYDTTLYNFSVVLGSDNKPDTNSYRNRFMLVFYRQFNADAVPVTKSLNQDNPNETGEAKSEFPSAGTVFIYPNPTRGNTTILQFSNMLPGEYETCIYNSNGQKLATKIIQNHGGQLSVTLPVQPSWAPGVYSVRVMNKSFGKVKNLKLVVNR